MQEIARAAGVGQGTLYRRFANKGQLCMALVDTQMSDFPNDIYGKVTDHPIMLAEKLVSCFAVPLFFNGSPRGVLLVGKRISYSFPEHEQEKVKESAETLEQLLRSHILGGGD